MSRRFPWMLLLGAATFLAVGLAFGNVWWRVRSTELAVATRARQAVLNHAMKDAILFSDFPQIQRLLDEGVDINTQNDVARTALMQAVSKPDVGAVKMLLDRGADVNARNSVGCHALYYAADGEVAEETRYQIAEMLLDHGAAIDVSNGYGPSALMAAIGSPKNDKIIQLLLARGANIRQAADNTGVTLLQSSAEFGGNPEATRWLLARMPEVPQADQKRLMQEAEGNALCDACDEGDLTAVKQRLAEGANVNAYQKTGMTGHPVSLAATPEILQLLLARGASPTIRGPEDNSEDSWSALESAATETRPAFRKGAVLRLKMLLDHGVSVRGIDGQTALMDAEENGNPDCMRVLLDYGVDANTAIQGDAEREAHAMVTKQTVLMLACYTLEEGGEAHEPEAVKMLLAHGADVNRRDGAGHTALYYARQYARYEKDGSGVVQMLLQAGAHE